MNEIEAGLADTVAERDAARCLAVELGDELKRAHAETNEVRHRLAVAESALRQKKEEVDQTGAELAQMRTSLLALEARLRHSGTAKEQQRDELTRLIEAQEAALRASGQQQAALNAQLGQAKQQARSRAEAQASLEAALHTAESRLEDRFGEIARLSLFALEQEASVDAARAELLSAQGLQTDQARRDAEVLAAAESHLRVAENRLIQHSVDAGGFNQLAQKRDVGTMPEAATREWLQKVMVLRMKQSGWWVLLPRKWRLRREQKRLARSGLFDAAAYLNRYSDVAASGMDPLWHYISHGIDEGRQI